MNTSKQLTDLIKNLAKKTGVNAQTLQKRYFMERFLERISHSDYNKRFIIKGGILISAMVGLDMRSTMDIDVTVKNMPLERSSLEAVVKNIMTVDTGDNFVFTFDKMENIHDESEYDCFRAHLNVAFDKMREKIKIDITTGDIITPKEVQFGYDAIMGGKRIALYSYNLETVFAEKIETILSRGTTNTRMRDYYDCYVLERLYSSEISADTFKAALKATSNRRGSDFIFADYETIKAELKSSKTLKSLWKNYQGKFSYAENITFLDAIEAIERLMREFYK